MTNYTANTAHRNMNKGSSNWIQALKTMAKRWSKKSKDASEEKSLARLDQERASVRLEVLAEERKWHDLDAQFADSIRRSRPAEEQHKIRIALRKSQKKWDGLNNRLAQLENKRMVVMGYW